MTGRAYLRTMKLLGRSARRTAFAFFYNAIGVSLTAGVL